MVVKTFPLNCPPMIGMHSSGPTRGLYFYPCSWKKKRKRKCMYSWYTPYNSIDPNVFDTMHCMVPCINLHGVIFFALMIHRYSVSVAQNTNMRWPYNVYWPIFQIMVIGCSSGSPKVDLVYPHSLCRNRNRISILTTEHSWFPMFQCFRNSHASIATENTAKKETENKILGHVW